MLLCIFVSFSFFPVVCFYVEYYQVKMSTYAYLFVQGKETVSIAWLENIVEMHLRFAQVEFKYAWISPNFAHLREDYAVASRFSTAWFLGLFTYSLQLFFNVSSTNMKELERVYRHNAW